MAELTEKERKARTKPGGSNVGDYDDVKKSDFYIVKYCPKMHKGHLWEYKKPSKIVFNVFIISPL